MIPSPRQVTLLRRMDVDALMRAAPRANMVMRALGVSLRDARESCLCGGHKARCEIGNPWFSDAELAESRAWLADHNFADRRVT